MEPRFDAPECKSLPAAIRREQMNDRLVAETHLSLGKVREKEAHRSAEILVTMSV